MFCLFVVFLQKEWLCLSCQTQRALSGQLGESQKISQPTYVLSKPDVQALSASDMTESKNLPTKIEPATGTTTPRLVPGTTEALKIIPTTKLKEEPAKIESTAAIPSIENELKKKTLDIVTDVSSVTSEKQSFVDSIKEPFETKLDVPNTKASNVDPVKEVIIFEVIPEKKVKPELPVRGSIFTEIKTYDHIILTERTTFSQEPYFQEQELAVESSRLIEAGTNELDHKMIEKITDISSTHVSQEASTKSKRKVRENIFLSNILLIYNK